MPKREPSLARGVQQFHRKAGGDFILFFFFLLFRAHNRFFQGGSDPVVGSEARFGDLETKQNQNGWNTAGKLQTTPVLMGLWLPEPKSHVKD